MAARTAVVARASELAAAVRASRRELSIAGVVVTWIAAGVWLDSYAVDLAAARARRRHLDRPAADPARRAPRRARAGRDRDPGRDGGRVHRLGLARGLHLPPAQHPVVRAAGPRPAVPDGARAGAIAAVRAAAPSGDRRDDRRRRGLGDLGPRVRAAQRRVRGDRLPLPAALPARRPGAARLRRRVPRSAAISS